MSGAATAIGIGTAIGGIGSLASGAIGASAAGKAADAQTAAANKASDLAGQAGTKAFGIQQDAGTAAQAQLAPYTAAGAGGLNALQYGLGTGGTANGSGVGQGSLLQGYGSFSAPTTLDEQNDPGYQARLALGTDALQKSAAARGSVLTGGTAKALDTYAQDYASNEYDNVYNRALQGYTTNANNYYTNQNNQYSRLAALAGSGQTAAGTAATLGQNTANSEAGTLTGTAATQGQDLTNAGAATASGYINAANAYSGGLQSMSGILNSGIAQNNQLNQFSQLQKLLALKNTSGGGTTSGYGSSSPYMNELGDYIG